MELLDALRLRHLNNIKDSHQHFKEVMKYCDNIYLYCKYRKE
jgi:hypothetical protein